MRRTWESGNLKINLIKSINLSAEVGALEPGIGSGGSKLFFTPTTEVFPFTNMAVCHKLDNNGGLGRRLAGGHSPALVPSSQGPNLWDL